MITFDRRIAGTAPLAAPSAGIGSEISDGLRSVGGYGPMTAVVIQWRPHPALARPALVHLTLCRPDDYAPSVADTDAELVARIRAGDQASWETLIDRHSGIVWRIARSVSNDDAIADDAMQTALLRLLESVDRLQNPAAVRSWLITTARREAIALSKARRRQQPTDPADWSFDSPTPAADDPAAVSADRQQNALVRSELRNLSQRCQELLTMHAHKVAYEEIAELMQMPIGSIGPTRSRCLDQLRRAPAVARLVASQ